jgi:cytochrome o ubiquinol oxidase subunit 2
VAEARTQAEFDQWVATVRQSPNKLTLDEYTVLAKQSKNNPATYYGSVADGLFESIMMKFMAPAQKELPMEMVQ